MTKDYINYGIIGNSRMLGCLNKNGELQRLFWPNIDHMQCINQFEAGIRMGEGRTISLTNPSFHKTMEYVPSTNILRTDFENTELGITITQTDFCIMDEDIMIRNYRINNKSKESHQLEWRVYSSAVSSISELMGTKFDDENEALIHYKRDYYMSVSSNLEVEQFQIGGECRTAYEEGIFSGENEVLMVPEGGLCWNLGEVKSGNESLITLQICFGKTLKEVKRVTKEVRTMSYETIYEQTVDYWTNFIKSHSLRQSTNREYNRIYERTLLVFKLMQDGTSGGLMAAPEVDEELTSCGRYAYCWGRDAAFISEALDRCGMHQEVENFFRFSAKIQEEDGSWLQRYCLDGNLAPSWGLQIDETGAILHGVWKHYESTKNLEFLNQMYMTVKRGAEFLITFMDEETGLVKASHDLWEERHGIHTYSVAAVYSGLLSSAKIARVLSQDESASKWEAEAERLKRSVEETLWNQEEGSFLRGIRTQLYPDSKMDGHKCMVVEGQKGRKKKVVCEDKIIDISLIGLSIPFGVFDPADERMKSTAYRIEQKLTSEKVGGIKRYEDDEYMGGNPWILTTLWLALYYSRIGRDDKALEYFEWATKGRTALNLLPEQIGKESGEPVWIVPLTWSHAMYALTFHELSEKNII